MLSNELSFLSGSPTCSVITDPVFCNVLSTHAYRAPQKAQTHQGLRASALHLVTQDSLDMPVSLTKGSQGSARVPSSSPDVLGHANKVLSMQWPWGVSERKVGGMKVKAEDPGGHLWLILSAFRGYLHPFQR